MTLATEVQAPPPTLRHFPLQLLMARGGNAMLMEEFLLPFLLILIIILLIFLLWRCWRHAGSSSNILQVGSFAVDQRCSAPVDADDFFHIHRNVTAAAQTLTLIATNTGECDINLFSQPGRQAPARNIGLAPPGGSGSASVTVSAGTFLFFSYTCSSESDGQCKGTITTNLHL